MDSLDGVGSTADNVRMLDLLPILIIVILLAIVLIAFLFLPAVRKKLAGKRKNRELRVGTRLFGMPPAN